MHKKLRSWLLIKASSNLKLGIIVEKKNSRIGSLWAVLTYNLYTRRSNPVLEYFRNLRTLQSYLFLITSRLCADSWYHILPLAWFMLARKYNPSFLRWHRDTVSYRSAKIPSRISFSTWIFLTDGCTPLACLSSNSSLSVGFSSLRIISCADA